MAKLAYTKLGAKINNTINKIEIGDNIVEVKAYLSVDEKLNLISKIIELSHDYNSNFSNPLKTEVYLTIEAIKAYTNITFTEKQLEDPQKLYDALYSSGISKTILGAIPEDEYTDLITFLTDTQNAFYAHRHSIVGVLENISNDYSDMNLDIEALQEKLANGENIELVKNIVSKLG